MHECYQLGIIDRDTIASLVRFCLQFWMGHYRMRKQQFDMAQEDIEEEKKKLAAIVAEKEAWHKWDNSTTRVMEKATKELEAMGAQLGRESKLTRPQPQQQPPKQQQSPLANLSLEDMMA